MSMILSHESKNKWEKMVKDCSKFLMNTKWNGRKYALDKFANLHWTSSVQLVEAIMLISKSQVNILG